jgi:hypothetical protein
METDQQVIDGEQETLGCVVGSLQVIPSVVVQGTVQSQLKIAIGSSAAASSYGTKRPLDDVVERSPNYECNLSVWSKTLKLATLTFVTGVRQ